MAGFPGGGAGPSYGPNLLVASYTAADSGTFVTDTDATYWRMTSGAAFGAGNIPGLYKQFSGFTPGEAIRVDGIMKRGTMTDATSVAYDDAFNELAPMVSTTSTSDFAYSYEFNAPASGSFRLYLGGHASASSQTTYHKQPTLTQVRRIL
jgi:hypothetical protein